MIALSSCNGYALNDREITPVAFLLAIVALLFGPGAVGLSVSQWGSGELFLRPRVR